MKKIFLCLAPILLAFAFILPAEAANKTKEADKPQQYGPKAKNSYSENDVKAFIYSWFAGFDHQEKSKYFKKHLDKNDIDMHYPGFPIKSMEDFERWYKNVQNNIQWNSHHVYNIRVLGSEETGFRVSLNVRWQAKGYNGKQYDMTMRQGFILSVNKKRVFIINKHHALPVNKNG